MFISKKIQKAIVSELKVQKALVKQLNVQEENYDVDLTKEKEAVNKIIAFYEKTLKDAA